MTALLIENEETQQTVTSFDRIQKNTRKMWLASLGLWGLGFDQANKFATRSKDLLVRAEERGVEVEEVATERVNEFQSQIRTRLDQGKKQVQEMGEKMKATMTKTEEEVADMVAPLEGYADMTAKEIVAMLADLSVEQLNEIKAFELAHEERVTVLRGVERLLQTEVETA